MVAQVDRRYARTGLSNVVVRGVSYLLYEGRPLTTRGRAVNPVLTANLRRAARKPADVPRSPIFLVGLGRSGTTLLGQLLSVHPEIAWLNEPKLLWHVVHPGEDVIGSYSQAPGRLLMDENDATDDVVRRGRNLAGHYLATVRRGRLLDKYPELIFRLDFVRAIFPDAQFLLLQRRAAAASDSIRLWSEGHRVDDADWWGRRGRKWQVMFDELVAPDPELPPLFDRRPGNNDPARMALLEWLLVAERSAQVMADPDVHLVRYEDLVNDPATALRQICGGLDLPRSTDMEAYAVDVCRRPEPRELDKDTPGVLRRRVAEAERALGYVEGG